jgi:hypothetical protein
MNALMSATYEIPLTPAQPSTVSAAINGSTYQFRTAFLDVPDGGWILDIDDASGNPLARGLPIVTGEDILGQLSYLGFNFKLFAVSNGVPSAEPQWGNLGTSSHVLVEF